MTGGDTGPQLAEQAPIVNVAPAPAPGMPPMGMPPGAADRIGSSHSRHITIACAASMATKP